MTTPGTIRIVTWNMGCGPKQYREHHDKAWDYLLKELKPDVAFVQEALVPKLRAMEELFSNYSAPGVPAWPRRSQRARLSTAPSSALSLIALDAPHREGSLDPSGAPGGPLRRPPSQRERG